MAKKAAKRKTKKASVRKAPRKAPAGVPVPLQMVVQFVQHLESEGQAQAFMDDAASANAFLTMDAECVDFVKDFIRRKNLPNPNQIFKALAPRRRGAAAAAEVPPCPGFPV
jgi:hypothetical protein